MLACWPVDIWVTPIGSVVLNLAASVLWDGGLLFGARAKDYATDRRQLSAISTEIEKRTGHEVSNKTLRAWLGDDDFWALLAEANRDSTARSSAVERMGQTYCVGTTEATRAGVLSVIMIEISRSSSDLAKRLRHELVYNKLDALEHGLGYVLQELISEARSLEYAIDSGFDQVTKKLDEAIGLLDDELRLPVEQEIQHLTNLVETGVILREAAVELQKEIYREGRNTN